MAEHYALKGRPVAVLLDRVTDQLVRELARLHTHAAKSLMVRMAVDGYLPEVLEPEQVTAIRGLHYIKGTKGPGTKLGWIMTPDLDAKLARLTTTYGLPRFGLIRWAIRAMARANGLAWDEAPTTARKQQIEQRRALAS